MKRKPAARHSCPPPAGVSSDLVKAGHHNVDLDAEVESNRPIDAESVKETVLMSIIGRS